MYNRYMDKKVNKIGIFGGAFDPPHISHIEMAKSIAIERGYTKMVILPSKTPPHKKLQTTSEDRFSMLRRAFSSDFVISDIELNYDGIGYAYNYIPLLKEAYGENIEYIIGGDSIINFDKWYRYKEVLNMVDIVVVARDNDKKLAKEYIDKFRKLTNKSIVLSDIIPKSMSSTDIRNMIRLHLSVDKYLPQKVLDYIRENNLYNEYNDKIEKLKSTLESDRFNHSINTCLYALKFVKKYNLDYNKVFLSSLLHDCAKYKDIDREKYIEYAKVHCPEYIVEDAPRPVEHAFLGAIVAMSDYGIEDREILDAIFYHTTASSSMSILSKLIYSADVLEPTRDYEGVEDLRKIFDVDLEKGFVDCLRIGYEHLKCMNNEIYYLTELAYNHYVKGENK